MLSTGSAEDFANAPLFRTGFRLLFMMDNEYAAVGFTYDSFDDLMYDLMEETGGKALVVPGYEGAVVYQDPTGPRMTAFKNEDGWRTTPGFLTDAPIDATAYRVSDFITHVALHRADNGEVFTNVIAASDEFFALPPGNPVGGQSIRTQQGALSAWAKEYELFDDAAAWAAHGNERTSPNMLFSPSAEKFHQNLSPRDLSPYAKLIGEISAVDKRTNELTEQSFLVATINYPAGDLPVLFPGDAQVKTGEVFDGTVFLSFGAGFWASRDKQQA